MLSGQKVDVYFDLQQILLNTEDTSTLLEKSFPKLLDRLDLVGLNCQFIAAVFLSEEGQVQKNYFVDKNTDDTAVQIPIDWQVILKDLPNWERELLWGPVSIYRSKNAQFLDALAHNYRDKKVIESLVALPLLISHRMVGIIVFATSDKNIEQEFIEFVELLSNLISLAFRLEDTQLSLANITQEVYKMNARLHQLDKLKDDFVSITSHELRTPMTVIRSYAWMALHRSDIPLSQKLDRYLYRILISTERLINLVNDMLNVSRIESGHIEINPKEFDILTLVKDIIEEVKPKADEKRIELSVLENTVPYVFADPEKTREVLLNLIGNSLKFTYPGGSITIGFFATEKEIEISVKDNGAGVSEEDLGKLFKKFGKLDSSYVAISSSGGTGLGLFISRSLVELMHGRIWARSDGVEKGAEFSFSLPRATEEVLSHVEQFKVKAKGEAKRLEPVAI